MIIDDLKSICDHWYHSVHTDHAKSAALAHSDRAATEVTAFYF
jgi:hypothetical protein